MRDFHVARLMGLCFAVAGFCGLWVFFHEVSITTIVSALATMFVGFVLTIILLTLIGVTFIGTLWLSRPWRALNTIRRNRPIVEFIQRGGDE